jgi:hypothetical protein
MGGHRFPAEIGIHSPDGPIIRAITVDVAGIADWIEIKPMNDNSISNGHKTTSR